MIPLAAWFTGHWPLSPIHSWRADLATWLYTQLSRHSVIIGLIIRIGLASYAPSQRLMLQSNQEFSIHSLVHATGAHPPSPRGGLRPTWRTAAHYSQILPACSPPCLLPSPWKLFLQGLPKSWAFSGGPVVKTLHCQCRVHGFDPWLGN